MYTGVTMKAEAHRRAIQESIEEIEDAVKRGVEDRQRTLGFHCSVAAADMLELYLHEQNLIDPGTVIKHDFFASLRVANERIKADFPNKAEIFSLMHRLESERNLLCYGKPKTRKDLEDFIGVFRKLCGILESMGVKA
jgi:hypothetical protein